MLLQGRAARSSRTPSAGCRVSEDPRCRLRMACFVAFNREPERRVDPLENARHEPATREVRLERGAKSWSSGEGMDRAGAWSLGGVVSGWLGLNQEIAQRLLENTDFFLCGGKEGCIFKPNFQWD